MYITLVRTQFILNIFSRYCLVKENGNSLTFNANQLKFGNYILRVYVIQSSSPENYVMFNSLRIQVVTSPLNIVLKTPLYSELNWNERLHLDFYESSFDPDLTGTRNKTDLSFDVLCVSGEPSLQSELLTLAETKSKQQNVDFKSIGFNLAFESSLFNIRFFDKDCFFDQPQPFMLNNPIEINPNTKSIDINAAALFLNRTVYPMNFEVIAHKDSRVTFSNVISVALNLSSMVKVIPSKNLNEMESQLGQLDSMAEKDPKRALGMLSSFADAINQRADSNDVIHFY